MSDDEVSRGGIAEAHLAMIRACCPRENLTQHRMEGLGLTAPLTAKLLVSK